MRSSQDTTLYIVAYDISDNKRRTRVHRVLCGYGTWTQYSLFECWLTRRQLVELQAKLVKWLRPEQDSVRLYALCAGCVERVITVGGTPPREPPAILF
ncbi:CRISPR-associated endonuclease Cas2 [Kallotenue papyrolyticum]|uniref:CRISPR-associated endonuclease Cas2 n=1 Tax=Kallotenue papyrolyticum TaxID=1325125 RepID=UPI0004922707|nr:CRISPR-associated endonuclease Cas2 [Kallotenue papyrolyticum]